MIDDTVTEDDFAAVAQAREAKLRAALRAAPEIAARLRSRAVPADGRTEAGDLHEWRTPLLTEHADAADELLVVLQSWVDEFAPQLGVSWPRSVGWRNPQNGHIQDAGADADLIGFKAGTTPEAASILVSRLGAWLLWHDQQIANLPGADAYQDEIAALIRDLRGKAGLFKTRIRETSPRACPRCGSEVLVEFFGEPMANAEARGERLNPTALRWETEDEAANQFARAVDGVTVSCAACGWTPEPRPGQMGRWMLGDHARPATLNPGRRDLLDPNDVAWTIGQAAEHFGYKPDTIRAWVRDGSVAPVLGRLPRETLLAEYVRRREGVVKNQLR